MSEDTRKMTDSPATTAPGPADPDQATAAPDQAGDSVPANWDDVFKHPRFKQLLERAKTAERELERRMAEAEEAKQKELKDQQKWKELYQQELEKSAALASQVESLRQSSIIATVTRALEDAARRHDPPFSPQAIEDLALFVKFDELSDDDGKPVGIDAAVRKLAQERPYLLEQRRGDPGSPAERMKAGKGRSTAPRRPLTL